MIITYLLVPWEAPFMPLLRNPQVPAPQWSTHGFGGSLLLAVCSILGLARGEFRSRLWVLTARVGSLVVLVPSLLISSWY